MDKRHQGRDCYRDVLSFASCQRGSLRFRVEGLGVWGLGFRALGTIGKPRLYERSFGARVYASYSLNSSKLLVSPSITLILQSPILSPVYPSSGSLDHSSYNTLTTKEENTRQGMRNSSHRLNLLRPIIHLPPPPPNIKIFTVYSKVQQWGVFNIWRVPGGVVSFEGEGISRTGWGRRSFGCIPTTLLQVPPVQFLFFLPAVLTISRNW